MKTSFPLVTPAESWTVRLLGPPVLRTPTGPLVLLERKAAALLAYLAVEGVARRAVLISFLWPETPEAAARNNLVHVLRKLAGLAGQPLIEGRETLTLAPAVQVDVATFPLVRTDGTHRLNGLGEYRLLSTCLYDDCPDLDDWLRAERERIEEWYLLALREHGVRLEQAGDYASALLYAQRLLDLDPLSEDAHQRLMRLHARTGNRHRAWRIFERLCVRLHLEFGAEPLPETAALAQALRHGIPLHPLTHAGSTVPA